MHGCAALALAYAFYAARALKFGERDSSGLVYVIRHGEKWTNHGSTGCLNMYGQARAKHLRHVFTGQPLPAMNNEIFYPPKKIFAHRYGVVMDGSRPCQRCNQTVTPLAEALGVPIDLTHGGEMAGEEGFGGGNAGTVLAVKAALKATGGPILIAWEHANIRHLTARFGVAEDRIPTWVKIDFSSIYVLEFDAEANLLQFRVTLEACRLPQDLA